MKKFLIAFAVAAIAVAGSFAQDAVADAMAAAEAAREEVPQSLQGTWYDKKYDCNWVFSLITTEKALCKLVDASTGHVYYKFTKDNVQNFQQKHDVTSGVTISFECAAKNRKYVFNKSISGTLDLNIDIYNTSYEERHQATITFKGAQMD